MIPLTHYLTLSALLFGIGIFGIFINRKNVIVLLMCLELILLSVSTNFIAFAKAANALEGQVFVLFILTVAAAETALGLALLVVLFKQKKTIRVEALNALKG